MISRSGLAQIGYLAFDITVRHGKATVRASSLNSAELPRNGIAVLTSRWGHASRGYLYPTQGVYEYIVTHRGVVAAVHTHLTATPIPAGGMVIVAQGSARDRLRQAGIRGLARVSVSTRTQSAVPGGLYSAIGVGEVLIRDGIDGRLSCGVDGGSTLLTARIGKSFKMVSRPTGNVRPIPNNFAFWPR